MYQNVNSKNGMLKHQGKIFIGNKQYLKEKILTELHLEESEVIQESKGLKKGLPVFYWPRMR